MTPRPGFEDHVITVFHDENRCYPTAVTDDGDLIIDENRGDIIQRLGDDVLSCDECGRLFPDELADHGISPDWSEA